MSKLLGFGYVEEENKSPNDDDASSETNCFLLEHHEWFEFCYIYHIYSRI